jgi:cytochrome c551/c552
MRSSTGGLEPEHSEHIRSAQLCATCHTLTTTARDPSGRKIGSLNEQMPYPEWLHSDYRDKQTCQNCHMPAVDAATPVARILAVAREGAVHHQFVGANFLMQRMLGAFHQELNTVPQPASFADAADRTVRYLQSRAASIKVSAARDGSNSLDAWVSVDNLGGDKLPTAYPSRRVWIHVVLYDRNHRVLFESGAVNPDGSIVGNDNDADPARYEPHYSRITQPDQVQIYEAILGDASGHVTTGLISAVDYLKDNRLLPHGFDKTSSPAEIAVRGAAATDAEFTGEGHRIEYLMGVSGAPGPYELVAELWYQPIGYRWAHNLKPYAAIEPERFVAEFASMAGGSAVMLSSAAARVD